MVDRKGKMIKRIREEERERERVGENKMEGWRQGRKEEKEGGKG